MIDWKITMSDEDIEGNKYPNGEIDYMTLGFKKYGYGDVVVAGTRRHAEKIADLINTVCQMLIDGDRFEPGIVHYIDDKKGRTRFKFRVSKYNMDNGGVHQKLIQLIPDFETGEFVKSKSKRRRKLK